MTLRKIESEKHNPLMAWWQVSNAAHLGRFETQLQGYRRFASDVQKVWSDACRDETVAFLASQKKMASTMQALAQCRRPQDLVAAQSDVIASLLDGASRQAKTWVEFAGKIHDCYAEMTREASEETLGQAADVLAHNPVVEASAASAHHHRHEEPAHA
jgi:hypothetical protein